MAKNAQNRHVVVVGGGFGGLYAAKALSKHPVSVTLLDRKNHHTFQPLLYQVATSVLSPGEIAQPLRRILYGAANTEVLLDEVTGFDLNKKTVKTGRGKEIGYDYLVVAAGARHSYFGHPEWEQHAPGLKTIEDAINIRRRLLTAFEDAEREASLSGNYIPLRFAVIGGGPTGVELAGAISDIATHAMARDFKHIDTNNVQVILLEAADRILAMYPEHLSNKAVLQLRELGVDVKTNCRVTSVADGQISVDGKLLPVTMALWATGITASPLGRLLSDDTDKAGRVRVAVDLSLPNHPEVFVLGDMALFFDTQGKQVPALADTAMQQAKSVANNILADIAGANRLAFRYKDKGSMATIGRNRAIARIGCWQVAGYPAWILWAIVHIFLLIGFRNRVLVFGEWIWAYFSRERSARLITE